VSWRTTEPARSWLAYGLAGGGATLWNPAGDVSTEHSASLSGLSAATAYTLSFSATASDETAQASLDLQTPPLPAQPMASTAGGALLLDGQPFFPIMVWAQCPSGYEANLASGVNLFAANPCHGIQEQLSALGGRALSAAVSGDPDVQGPALVGWFYPDEPDANHVTARGLAPLPAAPGQVTFLTLSNHFYSGADPPSEGRWMYPGLIRRADIVGFDLYPLQGWCRTDRLADVYDAQRELVRLANGRPTFQWIESSGMGCDYPPFSITPETLRAESWLAIAGGARGLGYFPPSPTPEVGQAIAVLSREIRGLAPALVSPDAPVTVDPLGGSMRAGARNYGGALYIIAVNAGSAPLRPTITAPGLDGRTLYVLDENRTVQTTADTFEDDFAPLAVHVYLAPPNGA
jgi:hypothetical protein